MNKEQKESIIRFCKEHIDDQGSVRVGWATEKILGEKQQNHVHDKIANTIIQTGEYTKEPSRRFQFDWNIYRNPSYKKTNWTERNPILKDFVVGIITAVFSLSVGLVLWFIQDQSTDEKYDKLIKQIEQTNIRIDSLIYSNDKTDVKE